MRRVLCVASWDDDYDDYWFSRAHPHHTSEGGGGGHADFYDISSVYSQREEEAHGSQPGPAVSGAHAAHNKQDLGRKKKQRSDDRDASETRVPKYSIYTVVCMYIFTTHLNPAV